MSQKDKAKEKLLSGKSDNNFEFGELVTLAKKLGFSVRNGKGSHRSVLYKDGIQEIIPLQPINGNKAKAYQVKQLRQIVLLYSL